MLKGEATPPKTRVMSSIKICKLLKKYRQENPVLTLKTRPELLQTIFVVNPKKEQ